MNLINVFIKSEFKAKSLAFIGAFSPIVLVSFLLQPYQPLIGFLAGMGGIAFYFIISLWHIYLNKGSS